MRTGDRPRFQKSMCCLARGAGAALLVLFAAAGAPPAVSPAEGAGNVLPDPETLYLPQPGPPGTMAVTYLGGGSAPLYGYSVRFEWDGAIVLTSPPEVAEGDLLSASGLTFFRATASGPNEITVDCVLLGSHPGVDGPGTMFTIEFTGYALGACPVRLTVVSARDPENNEIAGIEEEDGETVVYFQVPGCTVLDLVDIGQPASETGHDLDGWGPIEPAHSGGSYGDAVDCRVVYASAANGDGEDWATVDLDFGAPGATSKCLILQHLDGTARDAFEVWVYPPGEPDSAELVFAWPGDDFTEEIWYRSTVSVAAHGVRTVRLVSTEDPWSGWPTYGQMAFDTLAVEECRPVKDVVDIGNPSSEAGHSLDGWGPIEPATHGGSFGGIADCRAVYASYANGDGSDFASADLSFGDCPEIPKRLRVDHMDGEGKDAFELYLYPPGEPGEAELILAYPGDDLAEEVWYKSYVDLFREGTWTLRFVSTEDPWSGWSTYGQVWIDTILVEDITLVPTGISTEPSERPRTESVPMRPSPFRDGSFVEFRLKEPTLVSLRIYDVSGRLVREYASESLGAGLQRVEWDGRDGGGKAAPAGLYLYRLDAGKEGTKTGKVMLLR